MRNRSGQLGAGSAKLMCLLVLAVASFNCMNKPLPPVAPTWETQMTAPVSAKTYTLADLVGKDSSLISIAPGGTQLIYATTCQANPAFVGNLISLAPFSSSAQFPVGAYSVAGTTTPIDVPFPPGFPKGTTSPVPPARFDFAPLPGTLPGLDSVTFQSGTVELHMKNNLPVPVTIVNPIVVKDAGGITRATFDFSASPSIPSGKEAMASVSLAGVFFTHDLTLTGVSLLEAGSVSAVPIPPDSLVVAVLVAKNPLVSSAVVSALPSQVTTANISKSLAVTDSNLVSDLVVKSGTITIHFQSTLGVNALFQYTIPELLTPGGTQYSDNVVFLPRGSVDRVVPLAGFRLHSPTRSFISALHVNGSVSLPQMQGGPGVRVQATDNFSLTATTTSIVADSVVGVMKPTWVNVNAVLPVKLGDLTKKFRGQVNIPAANLRLIPQSTIRFPLQLNLKLKAEGITGQLLSELDVPNSTMSGVLQPIDFDQSQVGRFLSNISGQLPDSLRVSGAVLVNPAYDVSSPQSIGSSSWFGGQVQVSFPLTCSLTGGAFADTAAVGDTTGGNQGHAIMDQKSASSINSVKLHIIIDNAIPLQASLKLHMLDKGHRLLMDLPQTAGDSVTISAPVVAGGIVQGATHTERVVQLAGTEIQQFNNSSLVSYAISLSTAGTGAVSFQSTQTIRIRLWAEFAYQVNK